MLLGGITHAPQTIPPTTIHIYP